jgi:heme-degrading monooxygenase HmoA
MIARIWRGRTPLDLAEEYVDYVKDTGVEAQRSAPGNLGSMVLRRDLGEESEILVISLWNSWEGIQAFAGELPEIAVYYPRDPEYLLELEPNVVHYQVPVAELD